MIKELVDTISEPAPEEEEIIEPAEAVDEMTIEDEEVTEPADASDDLGILTDDILEKSVELDDSLDMDNGLIDSLGMNLGPETDISEDLPDTGEGEKQPFEEVGLDLESTKAFDEPEPLSIPLDIVETTLERVINKIFSEKFEGILIRVIEKAVTKEIDKLKSSLLEDSIGDEKL